MKKRYSEEQIIGFLRDGEAGIAVKDLCRKHGFSEASYYLWKSKFGGIEVARFVETEFRVWEGGFLRRAGFRELIASGYPGSLSGCIL